MLNKIAETGLRQFLLKHEEDIWRGWEDKDEHWSLLRQAFRCEFNRWPGVENAV